MVATGEAPSAAAARHALLHQHNCTAADIRFLARLRAEVRVPGGGGAAAAAWSIAAWAVAGHLSRWAATVGQAAERGEDASVGAALRRVEAERREYDALADDDIDQVASPARPARRIRLARRG
jgi:formiminotetrahydrofolate cyclodeaminase